MKFFSSPHDRDQAFKLINEGWVPGPSAGSVSRTRDGRSGRADPTVWLAMQEMTARDAGSSEQSGERAGAARSGADA